jgi:hypothetical protein
MEWPQPSIVLRTQSTIVDDARMKRALIVCGLLAWTIGVVFATASWMSVGNGVQVFRVLFPRRDLVALFVGNQVTMEGDGWMESPLVPMNYDGVQVSREDLPDGGVRLVISESYFIACNFESGFSWHTVTVDLHKKADGNAYAETQVDWTLADDPSAGGTFTNLTGNVDINSLDWTSAKPLVMKFNLAGLLSGCPSYVRGSVSVLR